MKIRTVVMILAAVGLLYGAYRGVSHLLIDDEARVRAAVDGLAAALAEGSVRGVLDRVADDFELAWRRRRMDRREFADALRVLVLQLRERVVLTGGITRLEITGDTARVTWEGTAARVGQGASREVHSGTGELVFVRRGRAWLLARADALEGGA